MDLGNGEVNLMQFSTILGSEKINLEQSYYCKTHGRERKSNLKCNTILDNLAECIVKGIGWLEKFGFSMHQPTKNYTSFSLRTKTQFFQVLCEEVMSKAMKMIDVDKIFLSKSNEGAVNVLNALKVR